MYLKINGQEISLEAGASWQDALDMAPECAAGILPLGVSVLGRTFSLNDPAQEYAHAHVLTYADEEGRRIYERSLQMLFITAASRVCPGARVRIEHSFGQGLYITVGENPLDAGTVAALENEMLRLVELDLPILRRRVTTDRAQEYFRMTGQTDRLRILNYRQYAYFSLYHIGDGPEDYYYGEMVPSTGYLKVFSMVRYMPGLVLMQPDASAARSARAVC